MNRLSKTDIRNELSAVIYYWIFIIGVLLASKILGYAEDNYAMIVILGLSTLIYIGIMIIKNKRKK